MKINNKKLKLKSLRLERIIRFIAIVIALSMTLPTLGGCINLEESRSNKNNLEVEVEENVDEYETKQDTEVDDGKTGTEGANAMKGMYKDKVKKTINTMTLKEKVGQLFIVGFEGYEANEYIEYLVRNKGIGGVILFGKNIDNIEQTKNLISQLNILNEGNKAKLFISIDEEGGLVSRIPQEMGSFESAWEVGSRADLNYAFEHGKAIGNTIKSLGFNLDFAPVLDVNSNPNNPVIGTRAFSDNPKIVKEMADSVYRGLKEEGIISVGKHFPGHGDTSVDSHYEVPVIDKSLEELNELELIPFKYAIENGIPMIMVSHLLLPQLDEEEVASLSPKIINDVLREKLGFEGVAITDDMIMGAVSNKYSVTEGIIKAIEAGEDMVILQGNYEDQLSAIDGVVEAVNSGRITEERIDESVYRIISLKNEYLN